MRREGGEEWEERKETNRGVMENKMLIFLECKANESGTCTIQYTSL